MRTPTKTRPFRNGARARLSGATCVPPSHPVAACLYLAGWNKEAGQPMTQDMTERQLAVFQNFRRH